MKNLQSSNSSVGGNGIKKKSFVAIEIPTSVRIFVRTVSFFFSCRFVVFFIQTVAFALQRIINFSFGWRSPRNHTHTANTHTYIFCVVREKPANNVLKFFSSSFRCFFPLFFSFGCVRMRVNVRVSCSLFQCSLSAVQFDLVRFCVCDYECECV